VWCLFELYTAITLGAKVIMTFPPEDAEGFYSKLQQNDETTALVPTINAKQAQATVESDRVRIFKEITKSIGMGPFNAKLQEYLEQALRGVATEALLQRGGVERMSAGAGGSKATLGLLRGELEQVKQLLTTSLGENKQELKQEVQDTKKEVQDTKKELKQEVQDTTRVVQDMKQELAVQAAVQDETKREVHEAKQEMQRRMATLEEKMDAVLGLLVNRSGP
jgi:chromosome segregation ATPase